MADTATLQLKMIAALLESTDTDDAKDAKRAVEMIKNLLGAIAAEK